MILKNKIIQVRNTRYEACHTMVINSEDYEVKEQTLSKCTVFSRPQSFGLCISVLVTAKLVKGKFETSKQTNKQKYSKSI